MRPLPLVGSTRPTVALEIVDLPQPLSPTKPRVSPARSIATPHRFVQEGQRAEVAILRGCRQSHVEAMQMWLATAKSGWAERRPLRVRSPLARRSPINQASSEDMC
jgi:hypothetical protein